MSILRLFAVLVLAGVLTAAETEARLVATGNLIYAGDKTSVCFSDRFLTTVKTESGINTEKRMRAVRLDQADELMATPFVIMNGKDDFVLPEAERALLRRWLDGGGFLLASAGCSSEQWSTAFKRELQAVYGGDCFEPVGLDHPLFHTLFDLGSLELSHGGVPIFEGIVRDGRLVCLFSKEGLNDTEHTQGCCCCGGNEVRQAEEVVADALVYALVE